MNVEQNRLETFNAWPQDAVVTPSRIAKAGFFSTHEGLTVECFSCHATISEWNYGDQVMARHRSLSPNCSFVLDPIASGNVPIMPVPTSSSSRPANMKDEAERLKTFEKWPVSHIVTPQALARAGFFYLNTADNTKCAYCNGIVRAWEPGDDPDKEHKRHFENCPFVLAEIVPRIMSQDQKDSYSNVNLVAANENLQNLGVQSHKGPKQPNYATSESRLKTFIFWPNDLIQSPDILAQAGFYYEGPPGDQVRCFHCDGGLRHWDPEDDPWTEHARWFPNCSFIKLVKGQNFVNACALEENPHSNLEEQKQKNGLPSNNSTYRRREVTERELQEHMTSEAALSALSIGLNVERVKRAIKEKLEQTGRGYSQPDALVEAALNLQHDEDDGGSNDEPSSVFYHVRNVLDNLITKSVDTNHQQTLPPSSPQRASSSSSSVSPTIEMTTTETIIEKQNDVLKMMKKRVSLEEENRILKEARLCKICMDVEVGIVFLPCGHLATCVNCAPNLEDCPVCRSSIKATVRTFLS